MNKDQAIEQHLENMLVFKREYPPGILSHTDPTIYYIQVIRQGMAPSIVQVNVNSQKPSERAYYEQVKKFVKGELESAPDDILIATTKTQYPNGEQWKPLTLILVQGSNLALGLGFPAIVADETAAWLKNPSDNFPWVRAGCLYHVGDNNVPRAYFNEMMNDRMGIIYAGYELIKRNHDQNKEFYGGTIIHELGHYYLNGCLTKEDKEVFLQELTRSVKKDMEDAKQRNGYAVSPALIEYVQSMKESPIYNKGMNWDEEYFTYLLQQLTGGREKFDQKDLGRIYELENCPKTVETILKYHPSWIRYIERQAPKLASELNNVHLEHNIIHQTREQKRKRADIEDGTRKF